MRHDDLERRLTESLHHEAERISPRDRRDEIMALVEAGADPEAGRPRWFVPAAAAAGVAVIAVVAWGLTTGGSKVPATPAGPSGVTASATGTGAPSTASSPTGTGSPSPSPSASKTGPATTQMALPAYFVGPNGGGGRWGLYREFLSTAVPVGATDAQKARLAVAAAINVTPLRGLEPYLAPWTGTQAKAVAVAANRITITLTNSGDPKGLTREQTRLSVQELVWTAQGAVGRGPIPVSFRVADGSTRLFGTYSTGTTYNRPGPDQLYQDLASIWIEAPVRGQRLPAGGTVVVRGSACTFEANLAWELTQGGFRLRAGSTTATGGCPTRGTWQVDLGVLAMGDYTFHAYEPSAQDGQPLQADTSKTFTVG